MDQTIKCIGKSPDCEGEFVFTEKDQEFYERMGFTPPKRCKPCRVEHKRFRDKNGGRRNEDFRRG